MKKAKRPLSRDALVQIVSTNDKRRFTLSDDGMWIRAAQGHSIEVDLGLQPQEPPERLFHGTARTNLDGIFAQGLIPGNRQQVHLSLDPDTALKVGQRHGKPVILTVASGQMHTRGFAFFQADNRVWLTDHVPASFLGFDQQTAKSGA